jgi:hypothetical protein
MADEKRSLTPQEKKAHSYAKDRRNTYGQNAKATRRLIPLHKARDIRAARHGDKIAVEQGAEDDAVKPQPPRRWWKKSADAALGKVVTWKRVWRADVNARAGKPKAKSDESD